MNVDLEFEQACSNSNFTLGCRIPIKTAPWDANLPIGMLHPERNGIGMQIHLYLWGVLLGCNQKIGDEMQLAFHWDAPQVLGDAMPLGCQWDAPKIIRDATGMR